MSNAPQEPKKSVKLADRLIAFIQKRRIVLMTSVIVIFAGIAITGGIYFFIETSEKSAASSIEAFAARYDELRATTDDSKKEEKITALIADLKKVATAKGYSSARAFAIIASIHADKKDWAEAERNWLDSVNAAPKSYLAPISLYNAAAADEEKGDSKKAVELYTKCANDYKDSFPLAPRALFAVGRINEDQKDYTAANATYKKIIEQWPNDNWTKLAHGRILSIAAREGAK